MGTVSGFDDAKKDAFAAKKGGLLDFIKKYEKFLTAAGDRFTETGLTFGEVDLFCKLWCYSNGALPEAASGSLEAFYKRMSETPAVKKVLDGESGFGKLATYM